jgi:hypothetical protein
MLSKSFLHISILSNIAKVGIKHQSINQSTIKLPEVWIILDLSLPVKLVLTTRSSSGGFFVLEERKNTFSAVGFGHDKIPFLSIQHKDWKIQIVSNSKQFRIKW